MAKSLTCENDSSDRFYGYYMEKEIYNNLCLIRFYICSAKVPKGSDLQILHKNTWGDYRNLLIG